MKTKSYATSILAAVLAINVTPGCSRSTMTPPATIDAHDAADGHDHADDHNGHEHGEAPHGGTIADWGGGKYHVEFTVDHDKKETMVYVLGGDAKSPNPIASKSILLSVVEPSFQVELKPMPLEGEAEGFASRFVGQHESLGTVREFAGTISAEFDDTPYTGEFKEEAHGGDVH
jgi:hypothetical protein